MLSFQFSERYVICDNDIVFRLGAQACVLAFSTTDRESFEAIETWKRKVEAEVGEIPMVLVQNKIDLLEEAVVSE